MQPIEIRVDLERTRLLLTWQDGTTTGYPATLLREHTRDAGSVRLAVDGRTVPVAATLTITSVEPIGNYAVRLAFSDGHERGIFPWAYLAEIAVAGMPRRADPVR